MKAVEPKSQNGGKKATVSLQLLLWCPGVSVPGASSAKKWSLQFREIPYDAWARVSLTSSIVAKCELPTNCVGGVFVKLAFEMG